MCIFSNKTFKGYDKSTLVMLLCLQNFFVATHLSFFENIVPPHLVFTFFQLLSVSFPENLRFKILP